MLTGVTKFSRMSVFKKSKEGRVGLAYLQPYPQPGGYQAPEEDEDAETPVYGNDTLA